MSLNAKNVASSGGSQQDPIEPGTYQARLVQVIDLGVQDQRPYKGEEKPPIHTIRTVYELLDEYCLDENDEEDETKPRWVNEELAFHNLSCDRAKSTKRYLALDPQQEAEGDWTKLGSFPCMITVVNNESKGKTYTNIASSATMRTKDAKKAKELVNDVSIFSLDDPDMEVFAKQPDWLQDKIKENHDYEGSILEERINGKSEAKDTTAESDEAEEEESEGENQGWS